MTTDSTADSSLPPNMATAPVDMSDRLRAHVMKHGERASAQLTGIPRGTLARVIAGLPVRKATLALARESIAAGRVEV